MAKGPLDGLNPALRRDPQSIDPGKEDRRPLTLGEGDAQFRECWLETRRLLREERGESDAQASGPVLGPVLACAPAQQNTDRPAYEPALWNDAGGPLAGQVQRSTNCYAYAMNSREGHPFGRKPQPGQVFGTPNQPPFTCETVSQAVLDDGDNGAILPAPRCPYNQEKKKPPRDKPDYYLVALVVTSKNSGYASDGIIYQNDYHWYRQDQDGMWSHKPGFSAVTNLDSDGSPISNPETAGRRSRGA